MFSVLGFQLGTVFQGALVAIVTVLGAIIVSLVRGWPDRRRASNETMTLTAKIEEEMRGEAAVRFQEFRTEVHMLRNELASVKQELTLTAAKSLRRNDKLNMLLFILRLVMDELHAKDPKNATLAQARRLLGGIENDARDEDNSATLNAALDTEDAAHNTVQQVKADEAKPGSKP